MKVARIICALLLAVAFAATSQGKVKAKQTPVYVFGYALSATDSVIYLTEIQRIDTAYIEKKSGFMLGRPIYSSQLQHFIEATYAVPNPICNIFFHVKRAKLEKKYNRVANRARSAEDYRLQVLDRWTMTFRNEQFTPDDFAEPTYLPTTTKKKKKKLL